MAYVPARAATAFTTAIQLTHRLTTVFHNRPITHLPPLTPPRHPHPRSPARTPQHPPHRHLTAPTMTLPDATTLQTASFMDSVEHAVTILTAQPPPLSTTQLHLIDAMLHTSNGARGFFVTLLSNPVVHTLDDGVPPSLLPVVRRADAAQAAVVQDLLVKNAVMSRAMVLHYARTGEGELKAASVLTASRARSLLAACLPGDAALAGVVRELVGALQGREGDGERYVRFVDKWGYDAEQKEAGVVLFGDILREAGFQAR